MDMIDGLGPLKINKALRVMSWLKMWYLTVEPVLLLGGYSCNLGASFFEENKKNYQLKYKNDLHEVMDDGEDVTLCSMGSP